MAQLPEIGPDSWTYTAKPASVPLDHLRELIGDIDPKAPLLRDATCNNALTDCVNVYAAASKLCLQIATMFARRPNTGHEGASETWSTVVEQYKILAKEYKVMASQFTRETLPNAPVAQAVTKTALQAIWDDTDRRHNVFSVGGMLDPAYDPRR